jgi:hypothetical protein
VFQVTVEQRDVTPDNFDSVSKLVHFIRQKQAVSTRPREA